MSRRGASLVLAAAAATVVARLWVMPLASSLWLDEFGTVWVTGGGLGRVLERARLFPQSVPYAALVAILRPVVGSSETALRVPSLLAMLGALFLVGRLGRAAFGRGAGLLAAGAFLLFPPVEFAAADARPYAFAVLFATAALLSLRGWLGSGRARDGIAYVVTAAAAVSFQYLFAPILLGHAIYAGYRRRAGTPVSRNGMIAAAAALAVLLVPAGLLVAGIAPHRRAHAFGTLPGALDFVNAALPVRALGLLVPAVALGFLVHLVRRASAFPAPADTRDALVLLLSAALVPPIALFAASRVSGVPVFEGRYLLATAPAWAALLGGLLAGLQPEGAGAVSLAGALLLALVLRGDLRTPAIPHGREDWRHALDALRVADPSAPVLLSGSFAEAQDVALAADPRHQAYLVEPVRYYAPARPVSALPLDRSTAGDALAERLAGPALGEPRFALLERSSRFPSRVGWLDGLAASRGYAPRELWRRGPLSVRVYERAAVAAKGD